MNLGSQNGPSENPANRLIILHRNSQQRSKILELPFSALPGSDSERKGPQLCNYAYKNKNTKRQKENSSISNPWRQCHFCHILRSQNFGQEWSQKELCKISADKSKNVRSVPYLSLAPPDLRNFTKGFFLASEDVTWWFVVTDGMDSAVELSMRKMAKRGRYSGWYELGESRIFRTPHPIRSEDSEPCYPALGLKLGHSGAAPGWIHSQNCWRVHKVVSRAEIRIYESSSINGQIEWELVLGYCTEQYYF